MRFRWRRFRLRFRLNFRLGKICGDKVRALLRKHATKKQSGANRNGNAAYTALDQCLDEIVKQKEEKATEAEVKSKMAAEK